VKCKQAPSGEPPHSALTLGFTLLAALLVIVAMGMHIHRMAGLAFTNYDDMLMGLTVDRMRFHWWPAYYRLAKDYALWQGRIYFYFTMFFFVLPFFIRSLLLRATLSALLQLGATCSVGAVVGLYAGFRNAVLFVALACASLPYWRLVSPVNGFPFIYHLPVILFFSSLAVYIRRVRGYGKSKWRRLSLAFSWTAFFLSLFFYEALVPVFFLLAVIVSAVETRRAGQTLTWSIAARTWAPWFWAFAFWAALYFVFRWINPSTYGGRALGGFGPGERGAASTALLYYEAFSLPGANWIGANLIGAGAIGNIHHTIDRWLGTPETIGYPRFFVQNLTLDGVALAVLVLAVVAFWFQLFRRETEAPEAPPGRVGKLAALALACALLCPLPLAMTPKYRVPDTVIEVAPHLLGYYSFLAWCVVFALVFPLAGFALRRLPSLRLAAIALLACGCAGIGAATAMTNDAIYREVAELSDKWKLVDLLAGTRWFAALPPNSVFLAPGLWDNFPTPTWEHGGDYWSAYFSGWAGRPVRVIRDLSRLPDLLNRKTPVFYCEHQWLPGRLDAVLVIDPILGISPTDGNARSNSLLLISRANPASMAVEYRSSGSAAAGSGALSGPLHVRIPEWRYEHGAYISQLALPDLIAGTARVTDPESGFQPGPLVDFQRGFAEATEHSADGHYWHWSDGKDGEGELNLVNLSTHPSAVRFRASLHFDPQERRAAFDFILPNSSETIDAAPGETIERVWQLSPGSNRILVKCHAGRFPAPGDPRYIVFGIWDWTLDPVEGKP
jgi:hypothetical protein